MNNKTKVAAAAARQRRPNRPGWLGRPRPARRAGGRAGCEDGQEYLLVFGILIRVFISTLISVISTLISIISMLSVYALLTKCGAFAGFGMFAGFCYVCRILVRLPDSGAFASLGYV